MLQKPLIKQTGLYLLAFLIVIWGALPIYWGFVASIKNQTGYLADPFTLIPHLDEISFDSYIKVFSQYPFAMYYKNGLIIASASTILIIIIGVPAAYSFTRLRFPGRRFLFYLLVFSLMFPWLVLAIPVFEIYASLKLMDTYIGLIIIYLSVMLPLALWLLKGFFEEAINKDLEDAARVDGTSKMGAFFRVILPLTIPAIGAVAIFSFLFIWNDFIWVFFLTSSEEKRTAVVSIHYMMGSDTTRVWNQLFSAVCLVALPPIFIFSILQRYLATGLQATSGLKG